MKNKLYTIVLLSTLLFACGGGKKQTLEAEVKKEKPETIEIPGELIADTVMPLPGIKYTEIRKIDPAHPPVELKLDEPLEKKAFDLADYYSSVQYRMLDFTHKEEFPGFLGDASFQIIYERGMAAGGGINTNIILGSNSIIAGNQHLGYYHYDENGKFLKDIAKPVNFPAFDEANNRISMERKENTDYFTGKAQSFGDMFTFSEMKNKKTCINYYSISKQGIYYQRYTQFGSSIPINEKEMMAFSYNPTATKQEPIMYSFSIKGDTLCCFTNHNPLPEKEIKRAFASPESVELYYWGGQLNFRQPYNDTIYSFKSSCEINPRYILSYPGYKPDIETVLTGNKAGKYFIYKIKETNNFLFIIYTSDYDCPNNRKNGSVKFYYALYDKSDKQLYQIASNVFPEDFTVKNSIQDGIPVNLALVKTYENKLYLGYTKSQLKRIIDSKDFQAYPAEKQEKIKSLYDDLPDSGLLVAIFE